MTYEKEGISQYHHITYDHEREKIAQKHYKFLEELKIFLSNGNYRKGSAAELGNPITDDQAFNKYFISGHFYKNFHTNYHALWNLFYEQHIVIPQKFYVYDIACGPYTASITLLNFLHRENNLKWKSFILEFCDKNDWVLQKLYSHNINSKNILSFPVNFNLLPLPESLNIIKNFTLKGWKINSKICADSEYNSYEKTTKILEYGDLKEDYLGNKINLVFLSYPGLYPNEDKFTDCLYRLINSLSNDQRLLPTYIIYSHYKKYCNDSLTTQENISNLRDINIKLVTDNANEAVPFNNYYYSIFKYEAY